MRIVSILLILGLTGVAEARSACSCYAMVSFVRGGVEIPQYLGEVESPFPKTLTCLKMLFSWTRTLTPRPTHARPHLENCRTY